MKSILSYEETSFNLSNFERMIYMENSLKIFNNNKFGKIRTVDIEGVIYFVATDIAKGLGYSRPNDAIKQHCRCTVKHSIPHPQSKTKKIQVLVIPEPDIYRLATHSKLPSAEEFERWIFEEVLPAIRKTGSYGVQPVQPPTMSIEDMIIAQAKLLKELRLKVERQERKINDLTRKPFSECGYFTVREWLQIKKIPYQLTFVKNLSCKCAKYSRQNRIEIREKWIDRVSLNAYRSDVLEKMFSNKIPQLPTSKKHKNIVYVMAEFFNSWQPEERLIAIESFQEFFSQAPSKYQGAIWEALTTDINKIPEYIELKTMERVS